MKTISTTAIMAVMTVVLGAGAAAPAMAQQASPRHMQHQMHQDGNGNHRQFNQDGPRRSGNQGGLLGGLLDFSRDGENIEVALVRLSHRVDLTAEQQPLLEAFKTAALAAQADFSTTLAGLRPDRTATATPAQRPDITERLANRIALEKAHVDALTAVQPAFTALFASLTAEQQAKLMPQREQHMGWQRDGGGKSMGRPHPGMMAAPDAAPEAAPAAPPAPVAP